MREEVVQGKVIHHWMRKCGQTQFKARQRGERYSTAKTNEDEES